MHYGDPGFARLSPLCPDERTEPAGKAPGHVSHIVAGKVDDARESRFAREGTNTRLVLPSGDGREGS